MADKTIADTLSCVETMAPVKTETPTFVPLRAYTVVETLKEIEPEARRLTNFHKWRARVLLIP